MADWTDIYRNSKRHGDFAGRNEAEQDAYFEFFAGPQYSLITAAKIVLAKTARCISQILTKHRLRQTSPSLAYPAAPIRTKYGQSPTS